eukprot:UN31497
MGIDDQEDKIRETTIRTLVSVISGTFSDMKNVEKLAEYMILCCELQHDREFIGVLCYVVKIVCEFEFNVKSQIKETSKWKNALSLEQNIPGTVKQCAEKHKVFKDMTKAFNSDQKRLLYYLKTDDILGKFSSEDR